MLQSPATEWPDHLQIANSMVGLEGRGGILSLPFQLQQHWPIMGVCELMNTEGGSF